MQSPARTSSLAVLVNDLRRNASTRPCGVHDYAPGPRRGVVGFGESGSRRRSAGGRRRHRSARRASARTRAVVTWWCVFPRVAIHRPPSLAPTRTRAKQRSAVLLASGSPTMHAFAFICLAAAPAPMRGACWTPARGGEAGGGQESAAERRFSGAREAGSRRRRGGRLLRLLPGDRR